MTEEFKRLILPNPDGRPEKVIQERVRLATYTNKIGPILTRFNAQLFADPAAFIGSKDPFWTEKFFSRGCLLDGDDDSRASFRSLLSDAMFAALATGKAIAQVDTRIASGAAGSRVVQSQLGELEPYVVLHPRSALWDWYSDNDGFRFAKIHRFRYIRDRWDSPPIPEHDFTIYQREDDGAIVASRYTVRKKSRNGEPVPVAPLDLETLDEKTAEVKTVLAPTPIFSVKGRFEFPVLTLTLPAPLWMGDQLFEPQKSYFAQTAALEYALYCNNYSMPVIMGVDDEEDDPFLDQKIGEGFYLTLKTGQSLTSFERGGGTVGTAISYRGEIKRDIYDTLQQIAMSADDGAAILARSGESKKEDRRPEQLLLERYGQLIREYAKQILDCAAIAHGEDVRWEVDGFDDFLGEGFVEDLNDFNGVKAASIPSETFLREAAKVFVKNAAKAYNFPPEVLAKSLEEIDKASMKDLQGIPPEPPLPGEAAAPPPSEPNLEIADGSPIPTNQEISQAADAIAEEISPKPKATKKPSSVKETKKLVDEIADEI